MSKGILPDFNLQLTRISRSCSENTLSESTINCFGSLRKLWRGKTNAGGNKKYYEEARIDSR